MTGSFDPVHEGHLQAAQAVRDALGVSRLILIPRPPYGEKRPVPIAQRLDMLRLATAGLKGIEVADAAMLRPLLRSGDEALVEHLRRRYPGTLTRVYGTDSFLAALQAGFVERHLQQGVRFAVVPRPGYELPERLPAGVTVLPPDSTPRRLSSTAVRAALARGQPAPGLLPSVARYIQRHGLYGAPPPGRRAR
jgi:nicotinate-nucleotide adenylyltransferase